MARKIQVCAVFVVAVFAVAICALTFTDPAVAGANGCWQAQVWAPATIGPEKGTVAFSDAPPLPAGFSDVCASLAPRWVSVPGESHVVAGTVLAEPLGPRAPPLA